MVPCCNATDAVAMVPCCNATDAHASGMFDVWHYGSCVSYTRMMSSAVPLQRLCCRSGPAMGHRCQEAMGHRYQEKP